MESGSSIVSYKLWVYVKLIIMVFDKMLTFKTENEIKYAVFQLSDGRIVTSQNRLSICNVTGL